MKNPLIYMKNAILIAGKKVRYGNRLTIGWIQTFEKVKFNIGKTAKVLMGSYNQNRGCLHIVVPDGKIDIGSHCFFNINSSITCVDSVIIGDNCKFGNNLVIVDHDHNFRSNNPEFISAPIKIGNNVWCGADVVILKGSIIGDNCVIAAGTVVRGVVPDNTILYQKRENNQRIIERKRM